MEVADVQTGAVEAAGELLKAVAAAAASHDDLRGAGNALMLPNLPPNRHREDAAATACCRRCTRARASRPADASPCSTALHAGAEGSLLLSLVLVGTQAAEAEGGEPTLLAARAFDSARAALAASCEAVSGASLASASRPPGAPSRHVAARSSPPCRGRAVELLLHPTPAAAGRRPRGLGA